MSKLIFITLIVSLLSVPSWSETVDDLVERDGLFHEKFSDVPFTGEISGLESSEFKDGKPEGLWEFFNHDGSLKNTETWKNGVKQ